MIPEFVKRFDAHRDELRAKFAAEPPRDYDAIVRSVVEVIGDPDEYERPDPERIHIIDDGDYQGTLLFVIAATGYQPYTYWNVFVSYGSCSGCDTLQSIQDDGPWDGPPNDQQLDGYMTLALHIVQQMRKMEGGLLS